MVDVTVSFFTDNFPAGLALEQQSDSWNNLEKAEKKSKINRFGSIKRAVRMVVLHMTSFPPQSDRAFKSTLRQVAEEAKRLRVTYQWSGDKTITIHAIAGDKQTATFETTKNLPSDLPEYWRKVFEKNY